MRAPFLGTKAIAAGLVTRRQLQGDAWIRLFRDVYASASLPNDHMLKVWAAALILPKGAAIAGRSAAHLWGANLKDLDDRVEVHASRGYGPVRGLIIHTGNLDPGEVVTRRGIPVTTALHTTWDLALNLPELDAVAWIDNLAFVRRISANQLSKHAATHTRQRNAKKANDVIALCDPRAESAPVSRLRVHLVKGGLPAPTPQFQVFFNREFVARVDLAWPHIRLAVEYDGQWHSDIGQPGRDRDRLRSLNEVGWQVYSVTYEDMHDPEQLVRRIRKTYSQRVKEHRPT
jgi:hypothetical protein